MYAYTLKPVTPTTIYRRIVVVQEVVGMNQRNSLLFIKAQKITGTRKVGTCEKREGRKMEHSM